MNFPVTLAADGAAVSQAVRSAVTTKSSVMHGHAFPTDLILTALPFPFPFTLACTALENFQPQLLCLWPIQYHAPAFKFPVALRLVLDPAPLERLARPLQGSFAGDGLALTDHFSPKINQILFRGECLSTLPYHPRLGRRPNKLSGDFQPNRNRASCSGYASIPGMLHLLFSAETTFFTADSSIIRYSRGTLLASVIR